MEAIAKTISSSRWAEGRPRCEENRLVFNDPFLIILAKNLQMLQIEKNLKNVFGAGDWCLPRPSCPARWLAP
jgi:hypothetical protein